MTYTKKFLKENCYDKGVIVIKWASHFSALKDVMYGSNEREAKIQKFSQVWHKCQKTGESRKEGIATETK